MIYTITLNPSLDYLVSVENLALGMTNRTQKEHIVAGGKGINVSIVLKNLGIESRLLGFVAGFTGEEICKQMEKLKLQPKFISLKKGLSRINVKIRSTKETEINGQGPEPTKEELNRLLSQLEELKAEDILVLSGSIPSALSPDLYKEIMEQVKEKEVKVVVDATGKLLMNVLPLKPFLIKPNHHELGELFDVEITSVEQVKQYAKKLQEQGARNVLVSMAKEGAVLVAEDGKAYYMNAPEGDAVNSVGAGDSMVAGFLYGYLTEKDMQKAFRYSVCTGSATALSEGFATKEEVDQLVEKISHKESEQDITQ